MKRHRCKAGIAAWRLVTERRGRRVNHVVVRKVEVPVRADSSMQPTRGAATTHADGHGRKCVCTGLWQELCAQLGAAAPVQDRDVGCECQYGVAELATSPPLELHERARAAIAAGPQNGHRIKFWVRARHRVAVAIGPRVRLHAIVAVVSEHCEHVLALALIALLYVECVIVIKESRNVLNVDSAAKELEAIVRAECDLAVRDESARAHTSKGDSIDLIARRINRSAMEHSHEPQDP